MKFLFYKSTIHSIDGSNAFFSMKQNVLVSHFDFPPAAQ